MNYQMNRFPTTIVLLYGLLAAGSVHAELNDPPYFNLWNGTNAAGEIGGLTATIAEKSICGTLNCVGGAGTVSDYAVFRTVEANYGKGSGAIDPFLRFHHNEGKTATGNQTWEAAFHTDYRSTTNPTNAGKIALDKDQFSPVLKKDITIDNQAKDANAFNHSLMLGDLRKAVDANGYFHFLLDINEPSAAVETTLRLDELAFFVGETSTMNFLIGDLRNDGHDTNNDGVDDNLATVSLMDTVNGKTATKVWDMDFDALGGLVVDNINDSGPAGSGDYDMELLLHSDLFKGRLDSDYVYLYNFMGSADSIGLDEADAGFEEWAFDSSAGGLPPVPPSSSVPEPAAIALVGLGLVGMLRRRRRA